jgi:hypothetical protein
MSDNWALYFVLGIATALLLELGQFFLPQKSAPPRRPGRDTEIHIRWDAPSRPCPNLEITTS